MCEDHLKGWIPGSLDDPPPVWMQIHPFLDQSNDRGVVCLWRRAVKGGGGGGGDSADSLIAGCDAPQPHLPLPVRQEAGVRWRRAQRAG